MEKVIGWIGSNGEKAKKYLMIPTAEHQQDLEKERKAEVRRATARAKWETLRTSQEMGKGDSLDVLFA